MITIFTIPKPFKGHINTIQRNAIKSWMQLKPECEILLFGDDEGVRETADEFGIVNIPNIDKSEYGTPLLNSAFNVAQNKASNNLLIYVNTDILFFQNIIETIQEVKISSYIICGRRWDLDINDEINFDRNDWSIEMMVRNKKLGKLHGYSGIDYFIFKKGLIELPEFIVGRLGWDNWLLYDMKKRAIPIIDATESITTIHQNHNYNHSKYGKNDRVTGPELEKNMNLIRGRGNLLTIREADFVMKNNLIKRPQFQNLIFSYLSRFYFWRSIIGIKRNLQEKLFYN